MATIALDIGGTKIASAIFLPDGSMLFNRKRLLKGRTGHEVGKLAAEILAKLLTVARRSRIQIDGVGICVPGIVYSQTGRVWAPNIPGWENYPLQEVLRTVTTPDIEIYIDSDRTCYMYGEMWQGAAKDCHSAVFIAVGTGIGAGIIIDGHVLHGASDIIGATGWMAILGVTALIAALPIKKNTMPAVVSNIMPREMVSEPECGMQSVQIKLIRDAYVKNLSAAFPLMMYSAHTMRKIRLQFPYCTKP